MKKDTISGTYKRTKQRIGVLYTRFEVSNKDKRKTQSQDFKKLYN